MYTSMVHFDQFTNTLNWFPSGYIRWTLLFMSQNGGSAYGPFYPVSSLYIAWLSGTHLLSILWCLALNTSYAFVLIWRLKVICQVEISTQGTSFNAMVDFLLTKMIYYTIKMERKADHHQKDWCTRKLLQCLFHNCHFSLKLDTMRECAQCVQMFFSSLWWCMLYVLEERCNSFLDCNIIP